MTKVTTIFLTVSAETNVTIREAYCGVGSPEQSEGYAGANIANVKPQSGGQSQNGQPVEFGQPLFIIG